MSFFQKVLKRWTPGVIEEALPRDVEVEQLREELQRQTRRSNEFFTLIERVCAQRDEWVDMFRRHAVEHQNAQGLLEAKLVVTRQMLARAVSIVNEYRTKNNEPLLQKTADLFEHPVGTAKEFMAAMERLRSEASPIIDGPLERDRIVRESTEAS